MWFSSCSARADGNGAMIRSTAPRPGGLSCKFRAHREASLNSHISGWSDRRLGSGSCRIMSGNRQDQQAHQLAERDTRSLFRIEQGRPASVQARPPWARLCHWLAIAETHAFASIRLKSRIRSALRAEPIQGWCTSVLRVIAAPVALCLHFLAQNPYRKGPRPHVPVSPPGPLSRTVTPGLLPSEHDPGESLLEHHHDQGSAKTS